MKQEQIEATIQQTLLLLEEHEECYWSGKLQGILDRAQRARALGKASKAAVLDEIEHLYGGMGSFNDLVISRLAGHKVSAEEAAAANQELDLLRERLYKLLQEEKALCQGQTGDCSP